MADEMRMEARKVDDAWTANPDFAYGTTKRADFQKMIADLATTDASVVKLRVGRAGLISDRDEQPAILADAVTRAHFGPDPTQYGPAGCTRKGGRKNPTFGPGPHAAAGFGAPVGTPSRGARRMLLWSAAQAKRRAALVRT